MGSDVRYKLQSGVAVITLQRGASNTLVPDLRAALAAALIKAIKEDDVKAVVLTGAGRVFSTGVDVTEYDEPISKPWIDDLTALIEGSPKPVVAAIKGHTLGAGFELTLAAHARVAQKTAYIGLPEVRIGIVPNGGSTQRLPRLVGAQISLQMMLSGASISVDEPQLAPLFDQITDDVPEPAAVQLALQMAQNLPPARVCDDRRGFSDAEAYQQALKNVEERLTEKDGLAKDILHCVRAAQLLPFENGLSVERTAFRERLNAQDARGLRHVYTAEWRARSLVEFQGVGRRHVDTVAILGADAELAQDILFCVQSGQTVFVICPDALSQAQLKGAFDILLKIAVKQGRLDQSKIEVLAQHVSFGTDTSVLNMAQIVFDAGAVEISPGHVKPGTIWCVLNEYTPAEGLREELPVELISLRRYRPVFGAALAETAPLGKVDQESYATVFHYFSSKGDTVLCCADAPGLIGHRMITTGLRATLALIVAGAKIQDVEAAAQAIGFPKGFLFMCDRLGLEMMSEAVARIFGDDVEELTLLDDRAADVASGRVLSTGFCVTGETVMDIDPNLDTWMEEWFEEQDDLPILPEVSIERALQAALVNEAARMLEDGTIERPQDVDLCMVKAF
ncbi:MAG: enoyl-CoA hydratase-related protein, partial [Pseudomonadota bacterium]